MSEPTTMSFEQLNADCACVTLDIGALCRKAEEVVGDPAFCRDLAVSHPHLFSAQPFFLSRAHAEDMQRVIADIEVVVRLPGYQEIVLAHAPPNARHPVGPIGVFMGYDFHLGPEGPRLIEINTNAGGGLLNAYLLQAQQACCAEMAISQSAQGDVDGVVGSFVEAFRSEWRRHGSERPLTSVAIVDSNPTGQYLYPEFLLFQRLFEKNGIKALIAAPEALSVEVGALMCAGERIDLVYNRLTDFDLSTPASGPLREAYLANAVAVTPNPRAHALFAAKDNLALLSDPKRLGALGVDADRIARLVTAIPRTVVVRDSDASDLWQRRAKLFFKPRSGYGGKAAYRGDKVTRRVWEEILAGDYVAQELVIPGARVITVDGQRQVMKSDLRNYTYDGKVQLVAARIYQGQTTNFRSPGGGFAPVFVGDDGPRAGC